jgi:guanosine-diphosphatase
LDNDELSFGYLPFVKVLIVGNIGGKERRSTAAVFDLGGASTQIVFEPTFSMPTSHIAPGDHEYVLTFAGHTYTLYQHSHLGYGLMEARKAIHQHVYHSIPFSSANTDIVNPCLPPGMDLLVDLSETRAHMVGPTSPSPLQCRAIAETILNKAAHCALVPCSFNGVHQPKLTEVFPSTNEVYLFSYFYERTQPLGVPTSFSLHELRHLTQQVCSGPDAWDSFDAIAGAKEELKEIGPQWCLDLNFMDALLVTGYEFNLERGVKTVKKVNGNEVGWCLGASLPLLEGDGWTCKIQEII